LHTPVSATAWVASADATERNEKRETDHEQEAKENPFQADRRDAGNIGLVVPAQLRGRSKAPVEAVEEQPM